MVDDDSATRLLVAKVFGWLDEWAVVISWIGSWIA